MILARSQKFFFADSKARVHSWFEDHRFIRKKNALPKMYKQLASTADLSTDI